MKFVYSSVYTRAAKNYIRAARRAISDEKMAVLIQEVVGERHDERFYPTVSAVARSYNFYPSGRARPDEGVVALALGLGKTIVDGGVCWSYSPGSPSAPPPFASPRDVLDNSQLEFWAVRMAEPPDYDPLAETEYLLRCDLGVAELDRVLTHIASTYDPAGERVMPGTGFRGARVLNFAPLLDLNLFSFNDLIRRLLAICEKSLGSAVEIEFAMTLPQGGDGPARLAFLQVRPMVVSSDRIDITDEELAAPDTLLASERAMGNGIDETIVDVVYVRPESFEARLTPVIARELEHINRDLAAEGHGYLLIGFGRWGSSDPWLGIPVAWGDIAGARVIIEATLPDMNVELSQGSHFFHNISSFQVSYFSVRHDRSPGIDWEWLSAQPTVRETEHVRHVRTRLPLRVKVDGRTGRGAVWHA